MNIGSPCEECEKEPSTVGLNGRGLCMPCFQICFASTMGVVLQSVGELTHHGKGNLLMSVEDKFDEIAQKTCDEASTVECTPTQYRHGLRHIIQILTEEIMASEECNGREEG